MHIGEKIRAIRTSKGISQVYIAGKLGKTPQWLSNIEKGRRQISITELEQIAMVLEVKVTIFFEERLNVALNSDPNDQSNPDLTSLSTGTLG